MLIAASIFALTLLLGLFALEPLGIPISAVAAACALILLVIAGQGRIISIRKVIKLAPWQIVVVSLAMYLVVYGLRNAGLTHTFAALLDSFAAHGLWAATLGAGVTAALLSSIMNNMPSVLIGALSIQGSEAGGLIRQAMIYADIIGGDLGPKITPIGSILTLPILLVTLAARALRLSLHA